MMEKATLGEGIKSILDTIEKDRSAFVDAINERFEKTLRMVLLNDNKMKEFIKANYEIQTDNRTFWRVIRTEDEAILWEWTKDNMLDIPNWLNPSIMG